MKIQISLLGLVQVVLLLISVGFLWATIAFYLVKLQIETRTAGIGFVVVYMMFSILFFGSLYEKRKKQVQKEEGANHE